MPDVWRMRPRAICFAMRMGRHRLGIALLGRSGLESGADYWMRLRGEVSQNVRKKLGPEATCGPDENSQGTVHLLQMSSRGALLQRQERGQRND